MSESALLSRDLVERIVLKVVHALLGEAKPWNLYVVVMDPTKPYLLVKFRDAIMFEGAFSLNSVASAAAVETKAIALKKAELSWRTEKDTLVIQMQLPHLWIRGDVTYPGGIFRDGIAVGVSGLHWQEDQALCEEIVAEIKKFCIGQSRELQKENVKFVT